MGEEIDRCHGMDFLFIHKNGKSPRGEGSEKDLFDLWSLSLA